MLSLVLGAVAAAGSIVGGAVKSHNARVAARKQQAELDRLDAENQAYYNRRYYEDATQRADNQRLITQARAALQRNNMAAAGQAAVSGATNATSAATKEANNNVIANAVSSVAANAQSYKTHVEDSYRQQNAAIRSQQGQVAQQRAEASNAAIDGAVNGMNALAQSYIAGNSKIETPNSTVNPAAGTYTPANSIKGTVGEQKMNAMSAKVDQDMANLHKLPITKALFG